MAALARSSDKLAAAAPGAIASRSLISYAPALLMLTVAVADCGRYADTDLWGHLFFGDMLLHRGPHLGPDPFSYAPHKAQWLHHEWLSEALMAWIYASAGVIGLKLWKLACTTATIALVAATEGESGAAISLQFALLITTAFALIPYMQFRPLLFSYAFTAATVAILTRDNYRGRAPLWVFVPVLALWSNLHGSFFIGLGLLGTYAAVRGLTDLLSGCGAGRLIRLSLVTIASGLASLATPYGLDSWRAVAISIRNPMTRQVMADWRPLLAVLSEQMRQSHGGAIFLWCTIVLLSLFAIAVVLTPRLDDLALVAIAALTSVGAMMAVRNAPLALVSAAPVLARHLGLLLRDGPGWRNRRSVEQRAEAPQLSVIAQATIGGLALLLLFETGLFRVQIPAAKRYPEGAVTFMRTHGLRGNILNYFAWGQYLIWHCSGNSKIFIDGRYDLVYPPDIIRQYMDFYNAGPRAGYVLDHYPHDFVLMPPGGPASALMRSRHDWKLIFRDRTAKLYARRNVSIADTTNEPAPETLTGTDFP